MPSEDAYDVALQATLSHWLGWQNVDVQPAVIVDGKAKHVDLRLRHGEATALVELVSHSRCTKADKKHGVDGIARASVEGHVLCMQKEYLPASRTESTAVTAGWVINVDCATEDAKACKDGVLGDATRNAVNCMNVIVTDDASAVTAVRVWLQGRTSSEAAADATDSDAEDSDAEDSDAEDSD
jgi:hypothetical protein